MEHILVVDDNKVNLVSAKTVLQSVYKVTCVTQGMQALRFLEKNKVDLILLDKNMPEMDGFQVMAALKSNEDTKEIPIVFLTADGDADTETRCLEGGAQDFISKPFVPSVMLSRIGRILELDRLRNDLKHKLDMKTKEADEAMNRSREDALTGLFNREYAETCVDELLVNHVKGALFMIDLDNFKEVNDKYGHQMGDKVLITIAEILKRYTTPEDILCRIGGDEYIVFLNNTTDRNKLALVASNIITSLQSKLAEEKIDTNTSVSIGIVETTENDTFSTLYNKADKSLYFVKQNGKNSFHFYSDSASIDERQEAFISLDYLQSIMKREDPIYGSYVLDYNNFKHVYNFIRRHAERMQSDVLTVMFSLNGDITTNDSEYQEAIELLNDTVYKILRRTDVSTMYSKRQEAIILIGANQSNGNIAINRILDEFNKNNTNPDITISYEMVEMKKE